MAATYIKQLQSRDSAQRKSAINAAARAVDRDALRRLAIMCTDDSDPEIRDLARRAGVYIRQQLGELPSAQDANAEHKQESAQKSKKPPTIPVAEADVIRAKKIMDGAVSQQIAGENAKAIKYLQQAVSVNPNLRYDPFFINVAGTVTGADGAAAVALALDKETQSKVAGEESKKKLEKKVSDHLNEVSTGDWRGVMFDAVLLFVTAMVGFIMMGFWNVQVAQGYLQSITDNAIAVDEAIARGDQRVDAATGETVYISTEKDSSGKPRTFMLMNPDPGLVAQAQETSKTEVGTIVVTGFVAGLAAFALSLGASGLMHSLASAMGGKGRWPYLAHHLFNMLIIRTLILLAVIGIGLKVIFDSNGGTVIYIVAGLVGLIVLFTVVKLIGMSQKAYRLGAVKGFVTAMSGLTIFLIGGGLGVVLF